MEFNIASQLSEVAEITITPTQFTRYTTTRKRPQIEAQSQRSIDHIA